MCFQYDYLNFVIHNVPMLFIRHDCVAFFLLRSKMLSVILLTGCSHNILKAECLHVVSEGKGTRSLYVTAPYVSSPYVISRRFYIPVRFIPE
jgi:hypothetical protein